MALRKSVLRQHIRRTLCPSQSPWILALGMLAAQPITPLFAAESHTEWSCRPAANNAGWNCLEKIVPGPAYKRPAHSTGKRTNAVAAAAVAKPRNLPAAQVDWIDESLLTPEQLETLAPGCCGVYLAPMRDDAEATMDPEQAPMRADANSSEWVQESKAILKGDVRLIQGYRQLEADQATLDQNANTALLEGNIRLREPGLLLTGSRAEMNIETGASRIDNASYLVHEGGIRGDSEAISLAPDKVFTLEGGTFTRCEPDSNTWYLRGSEIKIDPNTQQGTGKHVRLNVKGIPVFYTPYIRFPAGPDRQSGFLFPSISASDSDGIDVAVPYYFNLAPNYDLTLTPRYIGDRGEMLEAELRHLSKSFSTRVSGAYLADDDGGSEDRQDLVDDGTLTEAEAFPYRGEDRWVFAVDQIGGMQSRWYSKIDYTTVSDVDYFRDLNNASLQVNSATHLRKLGELGYRSDNWLYQIRAEEFETLSTTSQKQYKQLPRVNINGNYRLPGDLVLKLNNEYVNFDHPEKDARAVITGERARLDYGLTWDKQWLWGFFKPSAMVKSLHYQLDDEYLNSDANDAPSFTAAQGSLDSGLFFEREGTFSGNRYLQTFEPRLFYFYSEQENQDDLINVVGTSGDVDFDTDELTFSYNQLFRDTRFSGGDRIDDDNRLTVGLTSRIIDPDNGIERFSASLGQIFYFEDRGITITESLEDALADDDNQRSDSEFAAQLSAQLGDYWRFRTDITWDARNSDKVSLGSASLRYQDDEFRLLNLSYRYNRRDPLLSDPYDIDNDGDMTDEIAQTIEQGDVSFSWPLFGNWSAVGRANYDFTHNRELETLFGVEYNDCCYRVRLAARKWLDNELINSVQNLDLEEDRGIFLEFQLKGLGSLGNKISGILNDGIYGYEEREETLK
ncbi:LPS-assembly protein LptD [Aestuariicella hydrocarbonica]|uniref:LPS-assembly protein LptD n=1 Tax=Pseudomaricurvus hydrocarbonicus TaxID=1470433 RepID=A0A9E5JWC7_9GAMM|nr:LPS-assembly protein LptD [Aestuariicella hydrocarbonica]NHO66484.1 LPS-assembly protein LptD [Aestuariicella hydrocarbonica]